MLAGIALTLGTVVLFKMKRGKYAWVTMVPTVWLLICTLTAGWMKIFDDNVKVGFLAHARKFQAAHEAGEVLAPAKTAEQMSRIIFNDYLDAGLCAFFMVVVLAVLLYGFRTIRAANRESRPSVQETPYVQLVPAAAEVH
jgi:carbon starvation protein